ncbi:hypothetical protein ACIQJT_41425 [Streptomyces sp. NPDC091972]|uniref:hypothetical protein n=1 Tax=Streptomyces sp. NPDC091972 TaxID=3366007 RepID=UPI0038156277
MGKPNTKVYDRIIRDAERKLEAVRNEEFWPLTGSEKARLVSNGFRGGRRVMKGKSPAPADRAIAAIFRGAEERYAAEIVQAQKAREQVIGEAAAARVAKKSSGWW